MIMKDQWKGEKSNGRKVSYQRILYEKPAWLANDEINKGSNFYLETSY